MSVYIVYVSLFAGVSNLKRLGYLEHGRSWMGLCIVFYLAWVVRCIYVVNCKFCIRVLNARGGWCCR